MATSLRLTHLLAVTFLSTASCFGGDDVIIQRLAMPDVEVPEDDTYLCTAWKVNRDKGAFIVGFEPNVTADHIHHVVVLGCTQPGSVQPVWDCGTNGKLNDLERAKDCQPLEVHVHLYGLQRDTNPLQLPEGVGFEVGGDSGIDFIVMQVHYSHALPAGVRDTSGVILHKTNRQITKRAGSVKLRAMGSIPAHSVTSMEIACRVDQTRTIHPYAYGVHTHGMGVMVSGYFVKRDVTSGDDQWTLIGQRDPQLPKVFVSIEETIKVAAEDRLAARCVMNNTLDHEMTYGVTDSHNEMCVFFLFYWVEDETPLNKTMCQTAGPPAYTWTKSNDFNNIPD